MTGNEFAEYDESVSGISSGIIVVPLCLVRKESWVKVRKFSEEINISARFDSGFLIKHLWDCIYTRNFLVFLCGS